MTSIPTLNGVFNIGVMESGIGLQPHVVMTMGDVTVPGILTRIHSECLTGDVFGSFRCDCRDQLSMALERIGEAGSGILIYLRQEGRGIGLANKLRAYQLQDRGFDTVDANLELGLPVDAREYAAAAQILRALGVPSIRLMTNNPDKIEAVRLLGITVDSRVPLVTESRRQNQRYLATKVERLGHFISM
ncbi:GTP cyclohydrolase II [Sphingomonas sp.]|uniref:GTP cyclohydrolase II n=3 Tax=Pseudomonadota TaxID=1224 RepID=UPI0024B55C46|nr:MULTISPECIES: GTP cyclohydrolase II [unclassified Sphingomonas]